MTKVSVIIPCFNEEEAIPIYYQTMCPVMEQIQAEFELIFVDDGSQDGTLSILKSLCRKDDRCRYFSFSRNFGKEAAIYAGLQHTVGDYVAVMDVDLQDPPELLPEMYRTLQEEPYDCVAARRVTRTGESRVRSILSDAFYRAMGRISKIELLSGARDYRLMRRNMVDAVLQMSECNRFSKGIFSWVGFQTKWMEYENVERCAGRTKWSMGQLFRYSLEGITGFSVAPLSLSAVLGLVFCGISFLMILVIVLRTLLWGDPVAGWPSLVCIIFLMGGIQLLCAGITGQYLSKTYLEVKHRPIYILRSSSDED